MKLRTDLNALRDLVLELRSGGREWLAGVVQNAITDIECLSEDLDMEREMTREMAADLAIRKPPL